MCRWRRARQLLAGPARSVGSRLLTSAARESAKAGYGLLAPERTSGGLRLYSEGDAQRVREMTEKIADGLSAAEAARVVLGGPPPPMPVDQLADQLDVFPVALDELPPCRRTGGAQGNSLAGGVEVARLEREPVPHSTGSPRAGAREDLLRLGDLDRGKDLVVRAGAIVDGDLELVAESDERPISEVAHFG